MADAKSVPGPAFARRIVWGESGSQAALDAFMQAARADEAVRASVASILQDVRTRGDAAVVDSVRRFDRAELPPHRFRVPETDLAAAARALPGRDRAAIRSSIAAVRAFHRASLPRGWIGRNVHGAKVGERYFPLRRVGLYIPGGQVPLVSTAIMTGVPARTAGCAEIAAFTPCDSTGSVAPALLGTLHLVGIREVYRVGGVQAIGAMAFGTESIAPVDKIFGPGNAYVVEAKRQVFGTVGVDLLPGPSEVAVAADQSANAAWIAADLLAQAEHGSGRERLVLVVDSARLIEQVEAQIAEQLPTLSRAEPIRRVLGTGFLAVVAKTPDAMADVLNRIAPEHLEVQVGAEFRRRLVPRLRTAGAVLLGGWSPTAVSDFAAGPSHELPTGSAGRFSSGLRTVDFLRRSSILEYDRSSLARALPTVDAFARMEQLDAHGCSVSIRFRRSKGGRGS